MNLGFKQSTLLNFARKTRFANFPKDMSEIVGLGLMTISAVGFCLMSTLVHHGGQRFPTMQLVFARSIIQATLALLWCLASRTNPLGPARLRRLLFLRGLFGAMGLGLFFYTIIHLPLADGTVLFFTSPAATALLAWAILKEPLGKFDITAIIGCFAGTILVARPEFMFGSDAEYQGTTATVTAVIAALVGAFLAASAYCIVRKIGTGVAFMVHVFYFGAISSVFSGTLMLALNAKDPLQPLISLSDWILFAGIGLSAFLGQCCINAYLNLKLTL